MRAELLLRIQAARASRQPLAVITRISDGVQSHCDGDVVTGALRLGDGELEAVRVRMRDDNSGMLAGEELFVHVHAPPVRLIIVGAVHIAQALAPMARIAGYDVTVVDPRGTFATTDRFPGIALSDEWPDDALEILEPDARAAVVTLTHDPKLDDPALTAALRSPAFYIAALGGRRTHSLRLERLREAGFTETDLARINGPAGLAIGATSPAEIAASILAQMIAVRHGLPAVPGAAP